MREWIKVFLIGLCWFIMVQGCAGTTATDSVMVPAAHSRFDAARKTGHIQDLRLGECSGLDASPTHADLLWALNDSGNGPYIYALGEDGRSFGRVRVAGAKNDDWEDLATFVWQGRPMILVADIGDNKQRRSTHTLYIIPEPLFTGQPYDDTAAVRTAWQVTFAYPDHGHDAESVAVDVVGRNVLILTKRDEPPQLFEVPLDPPTGSSTVTARPVTLVSHIPPPSKEELLLPFGAFNAEPTAMDISDDHRYAVVLTYKDAYLFAHGLHDSWAATFGAVPTAIPLPRERPDLRQREAICFASDGRSLIVTSEGKGAGIFRMIPADH